MDIIMLIATSVLSIIIGLFGIKLMRVGNALAAAALGGGLGYLVADLVGTTTEVQMIIAIVSALILAALAAFFKKFGTFLFCIIGVTGMLIFVTRPENWMFYTIYGGVGMLFAIAAMNWLDAIYIFATAFVGGIGVGSVILRFMGTQKFPVIIAVFAVPVMIGCVVQFVLRSREIGRKEKIHAEEVKKEISMEEEVESARLLLDEAVPEVNVPEDNVPEDEVSETNE